MRVLEKVTIENKEKMKIYLNKYLIELSEFDDAITFDKKGNPIYKYFNDYFIDDDRYPYYLMLDNKIAGIALVREVDCGYEIAEFYVLKEYRKDNIALEFAKLVINHFNKDFVFSTRLENKRAIRFWDKVCLIFSKFETREDGKYKEWRLRK